MSLKVFDTKLFLAVITFIGVGFISLSQAADKTVPEGENIALGKSYRTNIIPETMEKDLKPVPDYDKVLTDGVIEKSASGSFWSSPRCANFTGAVNTDVVVDLGREMPISGIYSRHGARPNAGICFPRKEEYYVSDNGIKFYKAGEFKNLFDNYSIHNELEIKKKFARGVKLYGINKLKTKGRYVLIRTYSSGIGNPFSTYVGYDEIFVIKGNFQPAEAKRNEKQAITLKKTNLPEDVLGYRIAPPDWRRIVREQPLFLALAPMQFLGDNEYHLSVGGTYVMPFAPRLNTASPISDITLNVELPSSVKLISYNDTCKLAASKTISRDDKTYKAYSFSITQPAKFLKAYMYYPYLVVRSQSSTPGSAGNCNYSYSYKAGDKKYTHSSSFDIIVDPVIEGAAPKRFITGFWWPYQARFLADRAKTKNDIISFYHTLGFNCLNGGNRSKEEFESCRKNNMTAYGGSGFTDGLIISGEKIPEDERFVYHPKTKRNRIGVCPTLLYSSPKYAGILKRKFTKALKEADHIYSNWEPYMFLKQGCICERCKKEFQKFGKFSDAEMDKIWPDCVIDKENKLHDSFSSYQYGTIVKLAQRLTRETGRELKLRHKPNFIIAYEPSFVDPDKSWFKTHNHSSFYKDIDMTIMWSYPNTIQLNAFDLKLIPGNTLGSLPGDFVNAKRVVAESGRKEGSVKYPKILFMGTEYMLNYLVMPKDYYFMSLLCFFTGLDGYGTWCTHFKSDARYTRLNAKANTLISKLENMVMDGKPVDNAKISITSPVVKEINGKKLKLAIVRAFKYKNKELIAVGNDHISRIYVKLRVSGLSGGDYRMYDYASGKVYQKNESSGYSAGELAKGVIIPVDGKSWAALLLDKVPPQSSKFVVRTVAEVTKQMSKDIPALKTVVAELR